MRLVKRSEFGWGPTNAAAANPRSGLVIHYDGSNQGLAHKPHSACITYWKNTRKFHTGPERRWVDIGYSFGACPHGYVFEGRGLNRVQAAQPGGNATWYSVTLMSGPDEDPTPAQITAVRQLRVWLMSKGVAGAVRGHRDFFSTSCPGDRLYRMVQNGVFSKAPSEEEDDMPSAKEIAEAVYDRLTGTVTKDVWAARERLLDVGQKLDPRTFIRQAWAYSKGAYNRLGEVLTRLDAQDAELKALREEIAVLRGGAGPAS